MSDLSSLLTVDRIRAVCPDARGDIMETIITVGPAGFAAAGIKDHLRFAHFIAQAAEETEGLERLDIDLEFRNAARAMRAFPGAFANEAEARRLIRDPKKLANWVYAGRNGNWRTDDGWRFRPSGLFRMTGRAEFEAAGALVGMDLGESPKLARHADSALAIALGIWAAREIGAVAGEETEAAAKAVTRLVRPELTDEAGLQDRYRRFKAALRAFAPPPEFTAPRPRPRPRPQVQPEPQPEREPHADPVAPGSRELSGRAWVQRFPTSRALDALGQPFGRRVAAFVAALKEAGASVRISATYRPKERAYLMHWAWKIAKLGMNPAEVPPMPGVDIEWRHATPEKSRAAAREMVEAYAMRHIAALNSRHTERRAIDMTISWSGPLAIKQQDGATRTIDSQPRNGSNAALITVGRGYGAIKLPSDPPHWSDDGR